MTNKSNEIALDRFISRRPMKLGSRTVEHENGITTWKLFGNPIAKIDGEDNLYITTSGYGSRTTLMALNSFPQVEARFKKGELYLNDALWDGEWVCLGKL